MNGYEIKNVYQRPIRLKVDKSVTISFDTGEIADNDQMKLIKNQGKLGTLIFVPEDAQIPPEAIQAEYEGKTPSKRLYNVLFVYWKQQGEPGDYQQFYKQHMEKIIDYIKDKLDQGI